MAATTTEQIVHIAAGYMYIHYWYKYTDNNITIIYLIHTFHNNCTLWIKINLR